jgi:poly(hydroxyalkanoate) depolymerase family esterase
MQGFPVSWCIMLRCNISRKYVSINSISQTIERALISAGLNPKAGPLKAVAATIEKALGAAGLSAGRGSPPGKPMGRTPMFRAPQPAPRAPSAAVDQAGDTAVAEGEFITRAYTNGAASRNYKLYVPSVYAGEPMPLIVMLHGCKQDPDDFASGTRMNEWAERKGFMVAYPAQTARENGANCWNWFEPAQQLRDGSEPSAIAGIVDDIAASHRIAADRVFVAGLSAGGAMAAIAAVSYPEMFAGVAVHSGMPIGAAHDVASAFAAMKGRASASGHGVRGAAVPTIVFHGDADSTVVRSNGDAVVQLALQAYQQADAALQKREQPGAAAGGKRSTTTVYHDAAGRSVVEDWVVHDGAHAWFGGDPQGSFTDAGGPDASAEIVRFFLQPR